MLCLYCLQTSIKTKALGQYYLLIALLTFIGFISGRPNSKSFVKHLKPYLHDKTCLIGLCLIRLRHIRFFASTQQYKSYMIFFPA